MSMLSFFYQATLKTMEIKDFMLFFGPLIGVIIGGSITSVGKYLELRSQRRWEVHKLRIQKIEDLLNELGVFRNAISKCGESIQLAIESGKRGDEVRLVYVPHYEIVSRSFERIRSLQGLYMKSAIATFDEMKKSWNVVIDKLFETATSEFSGISLQESIFKLKEKTFDLQREADTAIQPILRIDG